MHCNSKARQSIKVEKENENIKLRKKIKSLTTDRHLANRKETVWDRLSKAKKTSSTENVLGVMRSRPSIISKTSQRFQTFKHLPNNPPIQLIRKLLSPKATSNNKPSNVPNRFCFQKPSVASETGEQTFLYIEPIKEIMTARSFSGDSKSLLDSKIGFTEDSNEEYELAPLMNSEYDSRSSMEILNNVREFLQQQKISMTLEDIELVKDVIKSDCRYRNLEQNPDIFKEILKTQLQRTLKHEFAIKKVLGCLESSSSLDLNLEIESSKPINKIVSCSGHNNETQKFEVDIIFKNVPSLDKEIEILRALGEKLEATLRNSISLRKKHDYIESQETVITPSIAECRNRPIMSKLRHELYYTAEYYADVSVYQIGIRLHVGIVNEFYITQKTIVELKKEPHRPFYIPSNSESLQLKRTSFEKLKETPSELLHYLKPKNFKIPFNILEQDPVFFNSLFNKSRKLWIVRNDLSKNYYFTEKDQRMTFKHSLCEGSDSVVWDQMKNKTHTNFTKALIVKNNLNYKALRDTITPSSIFEPPIGCKQRRRIKRYLTPMPINSYCNPKNALFKTVLVGIVQMSIFILFIMALTYPEVRC